MEELRMSELPAEEDWKDDELEEGDETGQLYEHFRMTVDKGQAPMRVDKYLMDRLNGGVSRNRVQKAADAGIVMANGKPVKSSYKVKPCDIITVMMDRPRYETTIEPEDIPIDVVYEDGELLVINKPAGLVVHRVPWSTPLPGICATIPNTTPTIPE